MTGPSGEISDGAGRYGDAAYCEWLIAPSQGGRITLRFDSFATEQDYDFVDVYEGSLYIGSISASPSAMPR